MVSLLMLREGPFGRKVLLAIRPWTEIGGRTSPMTVHKVTLVLPLDYLGTNHAEVGAV